MTTLSITEYANLARSGDGPFVLTGQEPAVAEQEINITGSTQSSAPFNARTRFIMVHAAAVCALAFGDTPSAVAGRHRLGAGETRFYGVSPGQRVAVITRS